MEERARDLSENRRVTKVKNVYSIPGNGGTSKFQKI